MPAPQCSYTEGSWRCGRPTWDESGRCPSHRGLRASGGSTTTAPTIAAPQLAVEQPEVELPRLDDDNGRALTAMVRDHLEEYGLVRDRSNGYAGAENTGWTIAMGSTGFSVSAATTTRDGAAVEDGLRFHLVVSGKTSGLRYRAWTEWSDDSGEMEMHEPLNPESLNGKFERAFRDLGFEVHEVRKSGHQLHWDDDVDYEVITNRPPQLGEPPRPEPQRSYGYGSYRHW